MKDGLPGSSINTIIQDSLDFIWIGTNDGLCRFDGENFKIFKSIPGDIHSLSDDNIQNLHLDKQGNLYIMTVNGLDYLDLKQQRISRMETAGEGQVVDLSPTDIVETSNGDIYISSYYSGISFKKQDAPEFDYLYSGMEGKAALSSDRISKLELYNDSLLLVAYWDKGLDVFNLSNWTNQTFDKYTDGQSIPRNINTVALDANSGLWIGSKEGLSYLNLETKRVENYFFDSHKRSFLPDNDVIALLIDDNDNLWIGTRDGGLVITNCNDILANKDNARYSYYTSDYKDGSLSYRTVLSIFEDKHNGIWIGTHGGGLNYVENRKNRFSLLHHQPGVKNSLSYNKVWGITEDNYGNLWLGTDGDGINIWSVEKGVFKRFRHANSDAASLSDDAVISACTDHLGTIWVGTYEGGINRFVPESQSFVHYMAPDELPVNDVRCIYEDDQGTLWIGLNQGGICFFDREQDRFIQHKTIQNIDVRAIYKVKNSLWIGTYGSGLLELNLINEKVTTFNHNIEDSTSLSSQIIFSLYSQTNKELWIGTANAGLCRLDIETGKFRTFREQDGLSNNKIHKILGNDLHTIWISSNRGISSFDTDKERFVNFNWYHGVQSEEFHNGSGIITSDGHFVFGGIKGANIFNPADFRLTQKTSSVRFTGLRILNQTVLSNEDGIINKSIEYNPDIHLNHHHSIFTIDFQSIRYPFSRDITYQYILEGYDDSWSSGMAEKSVTYRNLPPGEYLFRVRTFNKADSMSNDETTLRISMKPPYWRTKMAYVFYFITLASFVIGIFRYRIQQYKIRNRLKYEQKLRMKEGKLHDERLEFFTNISHELRTPLTIINVALDELATLKKTYPKIRKPIDAALSNSNRLIELVNKLLEFRQVETGVSSLSVSQVNLNVFLGEFLQGFREMAKHNSINLKLLLPINDVVLWVDTDKFSMIINNLLSNAFKHTPSGGQIILSIDENEEYITLKVEDSGKGIPKSIQGKIFKRYYKLENESTNTGIGLALTKSLVNLHHASIQVESSMGKGAVFTINFLKGNKHFSSDQIYDHSAEHQAKDSVSSDLVHPNVEIKDNEQVILLVDDNEEILELLENKLGSEYRILRAMDGNQGIEIAKKFGPNLIISDIMMPHVSGTELCDVLKTDVQTSHIPIILLTAKGSTNDEIEGLNSGADDYISKPFKISILQARIKTILENRIKVINYFSPNSHQVEVSDPELTQENKQELEFLRRIENYILENYLTKEVSVFDLASELGFSRTTLYRKIKSLTGMSINAFVRSVKIKKCAELIAQGMNVSEAAFFIGFNDLKYFRECFKKQLGKNPSEFK
jgi:signal transduction histidine kinase/ligand-binding sensor domain-containing protein/DNA-binding response OmpR family regulator